MSVVLAESLHTLPKKDGVEMKIRVIGKQKPSPEAFERFLKNYAEICKNFEKRIKEEKAKNELTKNI